MSEALLLVAEGYEQIAAGIRKMVAAQKDTPKKEEKPVKKAERRKLLWQIHRRKKLHRRRQPLTERQSVPSLRTSPDQERPRR